MEATQQQKQKKGVKRPVQRGWHEMNRKQRREMTRRIQAEDLSLEVMHPEAAGIDIGNQSHYAAVPSSRDSQPVRCFGCTTGELRKMGCVRVFVGKRAVEKTAPWKVQRRDFPTPLGNSAKAAEFPLFPPLRPRRVNFSYFNSWKTE